MRGRGPGAPQSRLPRVRRRPGAGHAGRRYFLRFKAAALAVRLSPPPAATLGVLISALGSPEKRTRETALRALSDLGPSGEPASAALIELLADADPWIRLRAAGALAAVAPASKAAVASLTAELKGADPLRRAAAAGILASADPSDPSLLVELIRALEGPNPYLRTLAAGAMGRLDPEGPGAAPAVGALRPALRDKRDGVAFLAANSLALLDCASVEFVPVLIRALAHRDPGLRTMSALALGKLGPRASQARGALVKSIREGGVPRATRPPWPWPRSRPPPRSPAGGGGVLVGPGAVSPGPRGGGRSKLMLSGKPRRTIPKKPSMPSEARSGPFPPCATSPPRAGGGRPGARGPSGSHDGAPGFRRLGAGRRGRGLAQLAPGSPQAPAVAQALRERFADPLPPARQAAAAALAAIDPNSPDAVPLLIEALRTSGEPLPPATAEVPALVYPNGRAEITLALNRQGAEDGALTAASSLARMGPLAAPAVRSLSELIRSPSAAPALKGAAAQALGNIGPAAREAVGPLVAALTEADPGVRVQAACALAQIDPTASAAIPVLTAALSAGDPVLRFQAARALGIIGPPARAALGELTRVLRSDRDENVRSKAAQALGALRDDALPAVPALRAALKDRKDGVRGAEAEPWDAIDPVKHNHLPALVRALESKDPVLRYNAAAARGRVEAAPSPKAVRGLVRSLKDKDAAVRLESASSLSLIGSGREQSLSAVPVLSEALSSADAPSRLKAAAALGRFGPKAAPSSRALLEALGRALKARDLVLIVACRQALEKMGPAGVSACAEGLKDSDSSVRAAAAWTLHSFGEAALGARPALASALDDSEAMVRIKSAAALVSLEPGHPGARKTLEESLASAEAKIRLEAALTLSAMGLNLPEILPILAEAARESDDPLVRVNAVTALGAAGPQAAGAAPALTAAAADPRAEPLLRLRAVEALGQLGPGARSAAPALADLARNADDPRLSARAIETLGRLGPGARGALPALPAILEGNRPYAGLLAAEALGTFGPAATLQPLALSLFFHASACFNCAGLPLLSSMGKESTSMPFLVQPPDICPFSSDASDWQAPHHKAPCVTNKALMPRVPSQSK